MKNTTSQKFGSLLLMLLNTQVYGAGTEFTEATWLGLGAGANIGASSLNNTLIGVNAGNALNNETDNTFVGDNAGAVTTSSRNTFLGSLAGTANTTGSLNTFVGTEAGLSNTTGISNTFIGEDAGKTNTTGGSNTFIGRDAGQANTIGFRNAFVGNLAGQANSSGGRNTFIGEEAGQANTTGSQNTFIGNIAGYLNTTGGSNTFIGYAAGELNTSGSHNVFLGRQAGTNETGSHKLYIENTNSSSPLIYGEFDNDFVGINGDLGVGTQMPSSTLHVRRADGSAKVLVEETSATTSPRTLINLQNNGRPEIVMGNTGTNGEWSFGAGTNFILKQGAVGSTSAAKTKLLTLFAGTGNLEITGSIITGGPTCGAGCDAVFSSDYELPTIEEHAQQMYALGHLPNVGSTAPGQSVNLTDHMGKLLNELEHAHIYIAQLERNDARHQAELASLNDIIAAQSTLLASVSARLKQLEAKLE